MNSWFGLEILAATYNLSFKFTLAGSFKILYAIIYRMVTARAVPSYCTLKKQTKYLRN